MVEYNSNIVFEKNPKFKINLGKGGDMSRLIETREERERGYTTFCPFCGAEYVYTESDYQTGSEWSWRQQRYVDKRFVYCPNCHMPTDLI